MGDWDAFVRRHGPMVFGTAWRILGHTYDTEDVVQEVFLEAHHLQKQNKVRNWGGLLRQLATFRALDKLRQRRPTVGLDGVNVAERGGDPEASAIGNELAVRLRRALTKLPPREAAVFCLHCFDDLSNQEIAEQLEISAGAVGVALHKARARLEHLLAGHQPPEPHQGEEPCSTIENPS
ncbi:MAG: RNA polymerase sigma factor [Gemmataceae bacterium]